MLKQSIFLPKNQAICRLGDWCKTGHHAEGCPRSPCQSHWEQHVIGHAAVIHEANEIVVCNGGDVFNLHDLKNGSVIRAFNCRKGSNSAARPVQVACGENASVIVTGSCNGTVSIFSRETGQLRQELSHSRSGHVQTITVSARPVFV